MTPWHRNEYILKGVFLGLWTFVALECALPREGVRAELPWVLGWLCSGLFIGLGFGVVRQFSRGVRPWQNWAAFPLLVLLESPKFIYAGIIFGLTAGVFSGRDMAEVWSGPIAKWFGLTFEDIRHTPPVGDWLWYCAIGGGVLGFGLFRFREWDNLVRRFWTGLAVAAVMVYLGSEYIGKVKGLESMDARFNLGIDILLGLPFFYLLTFCGESEESEVEIMVLCAAFGISLHLMDFGERFKTVGGAMGFLVPLTFYFFYATRVLPGLRVFKHVLRGFSYMKLGRVREAIIYFRRALELDPTSALANQGMLALHQNLSLARIESDPELVRELDFNLCLARAASLLSRPPSAQERAEASRFLELVEQKQPALSARVDYLRAVLHTHAKDFDAAAALLTQLLNPETAYHPGVRTSTLYEAWYLALQGHPEVVKRIGLKELDKPGRRIEAIGAIERQVAAEPNDSTAKELKAVLYSELTEAEFVAAAANGLPKDFNYEYVEQLGLALVDDPDPQRRQRGVGYLHMAGRGLPARGPGIFRKLADMTEKLGDSDSARAYLEQVKRSGTLVGPANLARDQRDIFLSSLLKLADASVANGDTHKTAADEARPFYESAITDLRLYLESGGKQELETYRKLADVYAKCGDGSSVLNALLMVETALTYNGADPDLLAKKDSYYFSVEPNRLAAVKDKVASYFDVAYCVRKATTVLNARDSDMESLEWATHLAKIAKVIQPASNGVRLIEARCLLRRGQRDEALPILEDIRESKKGSGDEEDSWFKATLILGDIYLEELNRPDLAVEAFKDYKEFSRSGADTLFKIARAYEALGDKPNAIRFYDNVTAYEGHPRYWEAKEAAERLRRE